MPYQAQGTRFDPFGFERYGDVDMEPSYIDQLGDEMKDSDSDFEILEKIDKLTPKIDETTRVELMDLRMKMNRQMKSAKAYQDRIKWMCLILLGVISFMVLLSILPRMKKTIKLAIPKPYKTKSILYRICTNDGKCNDPQILEAGQALEYQFTEIETRLGSLQSIEEVRKIEYFLVDNDGRSPINAWRHYDYYYAYSDLTLTEEKIGSLVLLGRVLTPLFEYLLEIGTLFLDFWMLP